MRAKDATPPVAWWFATHFAPRMPEQRTHEITEALVASSSGTPAAVDRVLPLVYDELKRIARRQLRSEAVGHTLSTTAVVHEAYLRLVEQERVQWVDRAQFFALASRAMRRVLIDYARQHTAKRRGGPERAPVSLDALERDNSPALSIPQRADVLLALDAALDELQRMDERLARIVECRFFAGFTEEETAKTLGVSQRTVARDWKFARAWLREALRDDAA